MNECFNENQNDDFKKSLMIRDSLIINGHIHKPIKSSFEEIPVYLCPFFGTGCNCSITQTDDILSIEPAKSCGINGTSVNLKR